MSMPDDTCTKIVHTMLVKGQVAELLVHLPAALVRTFNKHPKMRATQVKNEFAVAEIHPLLALEDISRLELLQVRETDERLLADGSTSWRDYTQEQTHLLSNRYEQFPFCLHVWVDRISDHARLFLFAGHYLSDGNSGIPILNDILTSAASLSLATPPSQELLPMRPSLYNLLLDPHPLLSPVMCGLTKLCDRMLVKSATAFGPLIPPRSDQQDFRFPPPNNRSALLFASVFGAMAAAVVVGYAKVASSCEDKAFKIHVFANLNMCQRVQEPIELETVGCYPTTSETAKLRKQRIDVTSKHFWDLACAAKHETNGMIQDFAGIALPMVLFDQHFTSHSEQKFLKGIMLRRSSAGDTVILSVGRYPHVTTHSFRAGELRVESLHFICHIPYLAPATQFYLTSVRSLGYGLSNHYDEDIGKALFEAVVSVMKLSGNIESDDTLASVIRKVAAIKVDNLGTKNTSVA